VWWTADTGRRGNRDRVSPASGRPARDPLACWHGCPRGRRRRDAQARDPRPGRPGGAQRAASLGLPPAAGLRIGKHVELSLEADDADGALELATRMAEVLLANPVIEDFSVRLAGVPAP
jgi:phosphoribosylformylglycinamidine synthase